MSTILKLSATTAAILATTMIAFSAMGQGDKGKSAGVAEDWQSYQKKFGFTCMGPLEKLKTPEIVNTSPRKVRVEGYKAVELDQKKDGKAVLGVISTIKDAAPSTIYNVRKYVEEWKKAGAEAIIVGGDVADGEFATIKVLATLAAPGWPVYVIMGNNDSRGRFNRAIRKLTQSKYKNIFNLNMVRLVDGDGYDLVSLPGYYDKRFVSSGASCVYKGTDVEIISDLAKQANSPVILVSHGPPKDKGKDGIDVAVEAGNVGDQLITDAIKQGKIPFGVFGHIIEAGGKGTDLNGKLIKEGRFSKKLYLNPGSASSFIWQMNDGGENWGRAALLTIKGKKASYKVFKSDQSEFEKADLDKIEEETDKLLDGVK